MTNMQVRSLLGSLPTDADFEAFCLDYFPETFHRFSSGMDRTARINLLLECHDAAEIAAAWMRQPAAVQGVRPDPDRTPFYVPHRLSPNFTGRKETLTRLREQLLSKGMVALWGLGGLGKTQTAVAYAQEYRRDYAAVLWIAGDSPGNFEQGLFDLAQVLRQSMSFRSPFISPFIDDRDPAAMRKLVLDYLRQASDYLLICDNADAPLLLKPVWPRMLGGHVLFTTRSQDIRRLGAMVCELGKLTADESRAFLMSSHPAHGAEEELALSELTRELDGLPLALSQAATYLVEHQSRYADYLHQYRKQQLGLLEQGLPEAYPHSIGTAWAMSIEEVERASGASLDLLKLCALLHPDAIPEEIFAHPVPALGQRLYTELAPKSDNQLLLDQLLTPLLRHALIQRDRDDRSLILHRMVQQALLHRMPRSEMESWARAAVLQLSAVFPWVEFKKWPLCRRLLPQVPRMVEHIDRFGFVDAAMAPLLNQAAYFLYTQAQYKEAALLLRREIALQIAALGPVHEKVASSLNALGRSLRGQQEYEEAEPLLRQALTMWEQTLGPEHQNVAYALSNLGKLFRSQGKHDEAERHLRRALAIREQALGHSHLSVAHSLKTLGALFQEQGKHQEAELMMRRALHILEMQPPGSEDPDIAESLIDLGRILCAQGKHPEAEPLLRRGLHLYEQSLPARHPRIAETRRSLEALFPTPPT